MANLALLGCDTFFSFQPKALGRQGSIKAAKCGRCIYNHVKHLWWSLFKKNSERLKLPKYFHKKLRHKCFTGFWLSHSIPFVREVLSWYIESENTINKYPMAVFQNYSVVKNLMIRVIGKFAKTISCFYVSMYFIFIQHK